MYKKIVAIELRLFVRLSYQLSYSLGGVVQPTVTQSSNGSGELSLIGLCTGSYDDIVVTNVSTGCPSSAITGGPFVLVDPASEVILAGDITGVDPTTCGGTDGSIVIGGLTTSISYTLVYADNGILAGIKEFYNAEELVGTQACVVANLQPAKLMGMISEGMLMAARDEHGLSLIRPEAPKQIGTKIS